MSVTWRRVCAVVALLAAPVLWAQDDADEEEGGVLFYSGIGAERADADFDNLGKAVNLAFNSGVGLARAPWLMAEIAGSVTLIPGDNSGGQGLFGGGGGNGSDCLPLLPCPDNGDNGGQQSGRRTATSSDFQMFTLGIYAVGRTPGRVYATGRIGYRLLQSSIAEIEDDGRSGSAWGAGVGWRYGQGQGGLELGYMRYSSLVDSLSLSITYGFGGPDRQRRRRAAP